jgi:hypothetical protein
LVKHYSGLGEFWDLFEENLLIELCKLEETNCVQVASAVIGDLVLKCGATKEFSLRCFEFLFVLSLEREMSVATGIVRVMSEMCAVLCGCDLKGVIWRNCPFKNQLTVKLQKGLIDKDVSVNLRDVVYEYYRLVRSRGRTTDRFG